MRAIVTIPISSIDHGKLPSFENVKEFCLAIKNGELLPPIKVERVGERYKLNDGRHRLKAHVMMGKREIRAMLAIKEDPYPYKPMVSKEDQ